MCGIGMRSLYLCPDKICPDNSLFSNQKLILNNQLPGNLKKIYQTCSADNLLIILYNDKKTIVFAMD